MGRAEGGRGSTRGRGGGSVALALFPAAGGVVAAVGDGAGEGVCGRGGGDGGRALLATQLSGKLRKGYIWGEQHAEGDWMQRVPR